MCQFSGFNAMGISQHLLIIALCASLAVPHFTVLASKSLESVDRLIGEDRTMLNLKSGAVIAAQLISHGSETSSPPNDFITYLNGRELRVSIGTARPLEQSSWLYEVGLFEDGEFIAKVTFVQLGGTLNLLEIHRHFAGEKPLSWNIER